VHTPEMADAFSVQQQYSIATAGGGSSENNYHSTIIAMALQEVTASLLRRLRTQNTALSQISGLQCRRNASSDSSVAREIQDLEETDFVKPTEPDTKYDPLHRSRSFQGTPPSSRCVQGSSSMFAIYH
jgi:hypothetical protein